MDTKNVEIIRYELLYHSVKYFCYLAPSHTRLKQDGMGSGKGKSPVPFAVTFFCLFCFFISLLSEYDF